MMVRRGSGFRLYCFSYSFGGRDGRGMLERVEGVWHRGQRERESSGMRGFCSGVCE